MRSIGTFAIASIAYLCTSLVPLRAWAGAQEQAAAEALFQDARRLMQGGKFVEACPKLVDSNKLDPAVGTLLYLGECYERSGQTASAWATFQAASESARKAGQMDRARIATERADALVGKLSKLTITVSAAAHVPGLQVQRDGVDVGEATWGVAVPVDPAAHAITAKAPGKQNWSQSVQVEPNGKVLAVEIPALQDAAPAPPQPRVTEANATPSAASTKIDQGTTSHGLTQRQYAHIAGGIGVLGLAAGVVLGLEAKSKQNDSKPHCLANAPTQCDQQGVDLLHSGHTYATWANVSFAVGAVGLVTGAILRYSAPAAPAPASAGTHHSLPRLTLTPVVTERSSSLFLAGSF